jgi:plastocyanin
MVRAMRVLAFVFALMFATSSAAAELSVVVRTAAGRPVADAVVTLYPASGTPPVSEARFGWPMKMVQQNLQFSPFVLIAPAGATVAFPNLDSVRHHVYSFSPIHPFELKLYGRDETRTVRFDHPGAIALGCNIHDGMIAFIKVVDTPYAAKTGPNGEAVLHDVPPGAATMHVWHPYMKAPGNEVVRTITLPRSGAGHEAVSAEVRNPPARTGGY